MCGRSPEYNAYFAAGSAIFVSFLNIILESIKRSEQWFLVVHIVIWSGLILVAIVLIFGIYYENKFLVMVWIVLMLVFGVALIALRILDLTKLSENNEIIRTSIRILFHCALFSVWLWISIVYYLTL